MKNLLLQSLTVLFCFHFIINYESIAQTKPDKLLLKNFRPKIFTMYQLQKLSKQNIQ